MSLFQHQHSGELKRRFKKPKFDYPTLDQLPEEVLTEIFHYLPLKDRKNIRLQCHSLYEASIKERIIREEKFVISPCYSIDDISKTISFCKYSKLNLDFHSYHLHKLPTALLKYYGEKIIHLRLFECDLSDEILNCIVTYCINLQDWEIWITKSNNSIDKIDYAYKSFNYFDELFNNCTMSDVIRKNLVTLKIIARSCSITAQVFWYILVEKCITVFPSIKSLLFPCPGLHLKFTSCLPHEILDIINSSKLETIPFICDGETDHTAQWVLSVLADFTASKFKQIRLRIINPNKELKLLCNFFRNQKELEDIRLIICGITSDLLTELLYHITRGCPNLHRLHILMNEDPSYAFYLNERAKIADFRLESLWSLYSASSLFRHIEVPHTLNTLVINDDWPFYLKQYVNIFAPFSNLKHLETPVRDETLIAITTHLPGLLSLKIRCLFCSKSCFKPLRKLKNLRCLKISNINRINQFSRNHEKIIEALIFPKLKHLSIDFEFCKRWCDPKCLIIIANNNPLLEIICIKSYRGPFKFLMKLCKSLKKLYYFHCPIIYPPKNIRCLCEKLFQQNRSLRFLRYSSSVMENGLTLCFNPFSQKIVSIKTDSYDPFDYSNRWNYDCQFLKSRNGFYIIKNRCPYEADNFSCEI